MTDSTLLGAIDTIVDGFRDIDGNWPGGGEQAWHAGLAVGIAARLYEELGPERDLLIQMLMELGNALLYNGQDDGHENSPGLTRQSP